MKRPIAFLTVLYASIMGIAATAFADDFGARFSGEAPAALNGSATENEASLQGIEPAAGNAGQEVGEQPALTGEYPEELEIMWFFCDCDEGLLSENY